MTTVAKNGVTPTIQNKADIQSPVPNPVIKALKEAEPLATSPGTYAAIASGYVSRTTPAWLVRGVGATFAIAGAATGAVVPAMMHADEFETAPGKLALRVAYGAFSAGGCTVAATALGTAASALATPFVGFPVGFAAGVACGLAADQVGKKLFDSKE